MIDKDFESYLDDMSRSVRKAVIRDKPKNFKASTYYRRVRRIINQEVKMGKEILSLPHEIVNQYDYSDYRSTPEFDTVADYRNSKNPEEDLKKDKVKYSRK